MKRKEDISEFPFHLAYEHLPGMLLISSLSDNKIIKFNKALCTKLGFDQEELFEQSIYKLFSPESLKEAKAIYKEINKNVGSKSIEAKLITKNNQSIGVKLHAFLVKDSTGSPVFIQTYFFDTDLLKENELTFNDVMEASPYGLILSNKLGQIVLTNGTTETIFGYTKAELLTKTIEDLMPIQFRERHLVWREAYGKAPRPRKMGSGMKLLALHKNGKEFPVDIALNTITRNGETLYLATVKDISEERRLLDKIEKLAKFDPLTALPNRHYFNEELSRLVSLTRRSHGQFALLLMNLDHFKSINDIHGHEVGDKLLVAVANRCRSVLRKEDFFARLSGDEFAILLPEVSDSNTSGVIAKKLLQLTQEPFLISSFEIRTSLSIGIVIYSNGGMTERELLKDADIALFRAKKQGSKKYSYFSEKLLSSHMKYVNLQYGLLSAMDKNEFLVLYQPQVDLKTKNIIGIEALLRWKNPEFGFVLPEDFIPIAEKSGIMNSIGDWVFQSVCKHIHWWNSLKLEVPRVSINLSATQLNDSNLSKKLVSFCKKYKIDDRQIGLEITETAIMNPMFNPIKILNELHQLGFYLSIDDFGTGYSSLSRLSELPINALKIDKSFLKDLNKKESDIVIRSIINLAENLQLHVIAEGVETQESHDYLLGIHCQNAQGYLYHRPIEAEKLQKLLKPK